MAKFRKKVIELEAIQWTGENLLDVTDFVGDPANVMGQIQTLFINSEDNVVTVVPNDWIIKGVKGEFYPCKPDIFAATYEPAEDIANNQDHP